MEIKIHGYKLEGVKYEIKLNWNSKPNEAGINGGRIDMLEAKQGRKKRSYGTKTASGSSRRPPSTRRKSWKTSRISSTE